ncbi:demethoxyubiquinone hydroxylase family protein [Catenovulum sp. SX2]|uniref:demethoxyubiquinone hydroxylase family protein n=1 Tax=Catenovulum sp. SX2 TaxID=3398614 RepID=UPI003F87CEF8
MQDFTDVNVQRILRVDHAGELGAINIYTAQLFLAKYFYHDIVAELQDMLLHEKQHFNTFDSLLKSRGLRSCYALRLWAIGGFLLGLFTALLGRNAIWICTNAVETTVLHHLESQLDLLKFIDKEAYAAVLSIKTDEENHQSTAVNNASNSCFAWPINILVGNTTKFAIWLSTKL